MRTLLLALLGSWLVVAAAGGSSPPGVASLAADLAPGEPAPLFSLQGSDGRTYRLENYKGKQAVVLAWFGKAYSGA